MDKSETTFYAVDPKSTKGQYSHVLFRALKAASMADLWPFGPESSANIPRGQRHAIHDLFAEIPGCITTAASRVSRRP